MNRAMKTDSVVTDETIARPKEGVIIPIKYTGSPIKDAKGNIKGALEYILDVTDERKQKQDADEKINNLNTIPTPIMSIDTDFNITFMNPAGAAVAGKTPDECVGLKCFDLFNTPHCKTEKCACDRAMKTDSVVMPRGISRVRLNTSSMLPRSGSRSRKRLKRSITSTPFQHLSCRSTPIITSPLSILQVLNLLENR